MREEAPSNGEKKSDENEVGMMMIPCLDFSFNNNNNNGFGSLEEWKKMMSKKVREACEEHGYFVLVCDDEIVPKVLRENMLMGLKELFDLPEETKKKHQSTKPYSSYTSECPVIPLNQTFGVCDSHVFHVSQEFTNLMWPHGNPSFCETMNSISSKLLELNYMILKMIQEGYELPKHKTSDIEDMLMKGNIVLRLMKYKTPSKENNKEGEIGLVTHTDKNTLTILCQNDVQGLEVQTKTGKWIQLEIPQNAYVVVVGDALKAWSNGRLHAVRHRVRMKGDKERYSFGVFTMPKDEAKIEVPPELVDGNTHPLRYHSFTYGDYIKYFVSNLNDNALDQFAAL